MRGVLIVLSAVFSAATFGLLPASAAPLGHSKTVDIIGGETFSPDEFFTITFRFAPRRIDVHHGDTITWNNKTTDGHTVSIVTRDQLPKTVAEVNNCAICNQLSAAHFPHGFPPDGAPVPILDDLQPASPPAKFDSAGDSMLVFPPGVGLPLTASAQVTAPAGRTLNYLCAFHPWMQGSIRVVANDDD